MAGFPMDAEQIVRLVAAVLTELNPPKGTKLDRGGHAVLIRLAASVGVPLETYRLWPQRFVPPNARGPLYTDGIGVLPYGERCVSKCGESGPAGSVPSQGRSDEA